MPKPPKPLDEYDTWTADVIRKECTRRGLKVKGRAKKDERIAILRRHDVAKVVYGGHMVGDTESVSGVENRTKHCWYRLLCILFSNEFATRFGQSGDKPPRADLDTRAVADKSCFWQDVHVAYVTVYPAEHSVNALEFLHDFFVGIDPSTVKDHSSKKLYDLWKEMNRYYIVAEKKFTASGQHENDFPNFVDNRGFVVYLRKWLEIKPELNNFVKSGMLDKDPFDTLDENASASASLSSSTTTPSKSKVRETQSLDSLAASFATYVSDRRSEVERANASASKQLQEKSSILAMLGDILRQLADIDREIVHADESSLQRLEEDCKLLLHERQDLISKLRGHDQ